MRVASFVLTAALLLSDVTLASSKASRMIGLEGSIHVERELEQHAKKYVGGALEARQATTATIQANPSADRNSTIAQACITTLAGITAITNDAGLSACYNILEMDRRAKTFMADLRLYLAAEPKGQFTNVQPNNLMIGVTYPRSTVFTTMNTKRSVKVKRQSGTGSEIQQYTLMGQIDQNIDLEKLTDDQVRSLMVPAITINAVSEDGRQPVETALTTTDTAYFVTGEFRGEFDVNVANAQFQEAAIEQSSVFILPGTTFGIFPVGMIVTLAWLLIFCLAYGFGTFKRYQHREFYRKRMHMAQGLSAAYDGRTGRKV